MLRRWQSCKSSVISISCRSSSGRRKGVTNPLQNVGDFHCWGAGGMLSLGCGHPSGRGIYFQVCLPGFCPESCPPALWCDFIWMPFLRSPEKKVL